MKTERTARLSVALAAALGLLVWASPASAAPLRPGGIGPRGSGLRLSASGTLDTSIVPEFGGRHTCAVIADGSVRCWGEGGAGQLGNGGSVASNVPVTVARPGGGALTGVVGVAAGPEHTCAARVDGTVFCWGDNAFGRLGLGTQIIGPTSSVALQVKVGAAAFTGAVTVAAGTEHTCALRFDGTVHCWGRNRYGQLGNDFFSSSQSPVPVGLTGDIFTGVVAIAAGSFHTCAVRVDGTAATVHCWGANRAGQLGSPGGLSAGPVKVTVAGGGDFTGAATVVAGESHTCALRADGTVHCWGRNSEGQIGNNSTAPALQPVQVLTNAVALAAGAFHTCAVVVGGTVWCWGLNDQGQIGNNQTGGTRLVPTQVSPTRLADAVAVTAGASHSCARRADDSVRCWGDNSLGQLGNSVNSDDDEPVPVVGIDPVPSGRGITASFVLTCAARASGNAACWGDNELGQLGNGNQDDQPTPVAVRDSSNANASLGGVLAVAGSSVHACALRFNGTVFCWGDNSQGQLGNPAAGSFSTKPVQAGNLTDVVAVAGGPLHTCALRVGGRVSCWGYNASGQLGDGSGSTGPRSVPVTVVRAEAEGGGDLLEVVAIAAGVNHNCALHASGAVSCWGGNDFGALGDTTSVGVRSRAVTVVSLPDATALATGPTANHTCALRADGSVRCWGRNDDSQLGDGTILNRNFPVPNGVTDAVALAAGARHSCAARVSGLALCWGANNQGQLGNGTKTTPTPPAPVLVLFALVPVPNQPPVPIPFQGGVGLTAGSQHTCALLVTGQVGCWGDNSAGQVGDGNRPSDRLTVTAVPSFAFNVEEAVALGRRGRVAAVTALALCEPGAEVQIRVALGQGGVSGHGIAVGRCTGVLEQYEVTVPATGRAGFVAGPATAEAVAIVRLRGQVVDEPHWTRAVQLTPEETRP